MAFAAATEPDATAYWASNTWVLIKLKVYLSKTAFIAVNMGPIFEAPLTNIVNPIDKLVKVCKIFSPVERLWFYQILVILDKERIPLANWPIPATPLIIDSVLKRIKEFSFTLWKVAEVSSKLCLTY